MTLPIGWQWDMIVGEETAYVVYAETAEHARREIAPALRGKIDYTNDYRAWEADSSPVRQRGTARVWRMSAVRWATRMWPRRCSISVQMIATAGGGGL